MKIVRVNVDNSRDRVFVAQHLTPLEALLVVDLLNKQGSEPNDFEFFGVPDDFVLESTKL